MTGLPGAAMAQEVLPYQLADVLEHVLLLEVGPEKLKDLRPGTVCSYLERVPPHFEGGTPRPPRPT